MGLLSLDDVAELAGSGFHNSADLAKKSGKIIGFSGAEFFPPTEFVNYCGSPSISTLLYFETRSF
jgi:hypothetical protein